MDRKKDDYDDDDLFDEIEGWETEYYYLNNEQYDELIQLREKDAKKHPDDIHTILYLCEAYNLNKEYLKALETLRDLYKNNKDIDEIQYLILETLWKLGKNEEEFEWDILPKVLYPNDTICNICFDMLKGKRKAVPIYEIYYKLNEFGYPKFDEQRLFELLSNDTRLLVECDGHPLSSSIKRKPLR